MMNFEKRCQEAMKDKLMRTCVQKVAWGEAIGF
jgi:hypothetical protein